MTQPATTEARLNTKTLRLLLAAVAILTLTTLACGKSDYQIAQEAVDCMMQNDPDSRLGIMMMGGKDTYARFAEQSMTRPEIEAFRDENCG